MYSKLVSPNCCTASFDGRSSFSPSTFCCAWAIIRGSFWAITRHRITRNGQPLWPHCTLFNEYVSLPSAGFHPWVWFDVKNDFLFGQSLPSTTTATNDPRWRWAIQDSMRTWIGSQNSWPSNKCVNCGATGIAFPFKQPHIYYIQNLKM